MANTLDELTELVRQLPGIGPRQARRLALFIVRKDKTWVKSFAHAMLQARSEVALCERCMRIFLASGQNTCPICANKAREGGTLMLVEKDVDLENIERTGVYRGLYFVLGGTTSVLDKKPEEKIRIQELERRLMSKVTPPDPTHDATLVGEISEVIFALSATTEGEDTASYLRERLARFVAEGIRITLLGRGLSTGTELEYVDADTMRNALRGRTL
ncbi:MAG: recombination protein RecR [Candidatus Pacebacteria bacterium]|nr:recombination protein RecR [Candidatus Paceibacterota bacterium]